jgi:hypothetical protein
VHGFVLLCMGACCCAWARENGHYQVSLSHPLDQPPKRISLDDFSSYASGVSVRAHGGGPLTCGMDHVRWPGAASKIVTRLDSVPWGVFISSLPAELRGELVSGKDGANGRW